MMDHRGQGHDLEQAKPHSATKAPVSSRCDDTKFDLSQFPRQTISVYLISLSTEPGLNPVQTRTLGGAWGMAWDLDKQ